MSDFKHKDSSQQYKETWSLLTQSYRCHFYFHNIITWCGLTGWLATVNSVSGGACIANTVAPRSGDSNSNIDYKDNIVLYSIYIYIRTCLKKNTCSFVHKHILYISCTCTSTCISYIHVHVLYMHM